MQDENGRLQSAGVAMPSSTQHSPVRGCRIACTVSAFSPVRKPVKNEWLSPHTSSGNCLLTGWNGQLRKQIRVGETRSGSYPCRLSKLSLNVSARSAPSRPGREFQRSAAPTASPRSRAARRTACGAVSAAARSARHRSGWPLGRRAGVPGCSSKRRHRPGRRPWARGRLAAGQFLTALGISLDSESLRDRTRRLARRSPLGTGDRAGVCTDAVANASTGARWPPPLVPLGWD